LLEFTTKYADDLCEGTEGKWPGREFCLFLQGANCNGSA
jgi:hypothetical protein